MKLKRVLLAVTLSVLILTSVGVPLPGPRADRHAAA